MDKANKAVLAIVIIGISVYLGFSPLYEKIQGGVAGAVIGASFGAIFVVILTNYLLTKQTEVEQESKRSERVFEEKVSLYKQILLATEKMLEDGVIKGSEEMKSIPFLMLRLQMLGNDEAIMSYQKIYHEINNIFIAEPENDEVEVSESSSLKILELLGDFCNVCRLDLKVSDEKIDTKLFEMISVDIKRSNEIVLGNANKSINEIHEEVMKLDKSIKLKTIARDYIAWQLPNWPARVEFQVVTRLKQKIFFVQLGAERVSGKFVAESMKDLLPVFNSKISDAKWELDKWYSEYDNRIFTAVDITNPKKAAELFIKIINEISDLVNKIVEDNK